MNTIKIFINNNFVEKYSWRFKRTLLNLLWGLINLIILVYVTTLLIGTGWEFVWFIVSLMYGSVYWIIATLIFDALIGDEFDHKSA